MSLSIMSRAAAHSSFVLAATKGNCAVVVAVESVNEVHDFGWKADVTKRLKKKLVEHAGKRCFKVKEYGKAMVIGKSCSHHGLAHVNDIS